MAHNRKLTERLQGLSPNERKKVFVFTGARQTGKTTLVKNFFDDHKYISVEDPVGRLPFTKLNASQWSANFPKASLDEVQKEPELVESIKSVYDQFDDTHYNLLGSSQLLLLEKVRESLAGRCKIFELYPLTLPELSADSFDAPVPDSIFQKMVRDCTAGRFDKSFLDLLLPDWKISPRYEIQYKCFEHYKKFGGYPALVNKDMADEERYEWLRDYVRTYLERDVRDLANFRDLEPFVRLQQYLAMQTGQTLNASSIAKQLGVSGKTVQRYITYFEMSYQILALTPWEKNANRRLVKSPKLHYLDNGVLQSVLMKRGGITGAEFESLVIAELYKQVKSILVDARFYHLRTNDGYEVDFLIELPQGYFAFEIKMAEKVDRVDARHLLRLA
ncbi:MAG: ATP-binding protein, partial [Fibrobacteraceae bacterium]|nr:ATP-binding protein [Fibrobacteraceae bacterium]